MIMVEYFLLVLFLIFYIPLILFVQNYFVKLMNNLLFVVKNIFVGIKLLNEC